ncbi:MAG: hypothetical protein KAT17_06405 [Candidatus Aminicenantes bacterium]|nr:hypothetical protein [Candidatus Aminicenantes bacterium]
MKRFFKYFWGTIVAPANTFQRIENEKSISVGRIPLLRFILVILIAWAFVLPAGISKSGQGKENQKITPEQLMENLRNKTYTGKQITLQFHNTPLIQALKKILKISGLTIAADGDLKEKITLRILNIPWDQALSILLNNYNLRIRSHGNILKVWQFSKLKIIAEKVPGTKTIIKPAKKYSGEIGDFIFKNADLQNILLFFSKTYKFNIIIDPGVSGKVTCTLLQVPWDQALEVILRQHGLAMVSEGKIVKVKKF